MTQPAVSRSIQEMEKYYGVCLFERMNRRLYITECANKLYSHALHIIENFELMEKDLKNWNDIGTLRIGASISIGNYLLPQLVCSFKKTHPNIKIQTAIANSSSLQDALLNNSLDMAIIEGKVSNELLYTEVFQQDRMILIVSKNHPLLKKSVVILEDLLSYDILLRESGSAGRDFLEHLFAIHELPLEPSWVSTSTQALIKAVSMGLGITILPEMLVKEEIQRGNICACNIDTEIMIRDNYLVWHRNKYLSDTMQDFIVLCHEK